MKKALCLVLAGAMLLSSACKDSSESTEPVAPVSETETETETEAEEPAESKDSGDGMSLIPADSKPDPDLVVLPDLREEIKVYPETDFIKSDDSEHLWTFTLSGVYVAYSDDAFTTYDKTGQTTNRCVLEYEAPGFDFSDEFPELALSLNQFQDPLNREYEYLYYNYFMQYGNGMKKDVDVISKAVILRADEQVFAYRNLPAPFETDYQVVTDEIINLDTQTGALIKLADVVKDMDAFRELLLIEARRISGNDEDYMRSVEEAFNNGEYTYLIDLTGVTLYGLPQYEGYSQWHDYLQIFYLGNESVFDSCYYMDLAPDYAIHLDVNQSIMWDLDHDAKTETLRVEPSEDAAAGGFTILVDGQACYTDSEYVSAQETIYDLILVCADQGHMYLYVATESDAGEKTTYCFEFKSETQIEYRSTLDIEYPGNKSQNFNPRQYSARILFDLAGHEYYAFNENMRVGANGKNVTNDNLSEIEWGDMLRLKKPITGTVFNWSYMTFTDEEITIRQETNLMAAYTDLRSYIVFEVLLDSASGQECIYVRVDLTKDEETGRFLINGEEPCEFFF
ncbi:MAG: hypothetical protein J6Y08_10915 [Clostridiales bacterium]|nr:hypothetical protein [Clostridiales bacterium]